jgi:hypothetical protein
MDIKIIQILTREWIGNDGKTNTEIVGLGDDSLVYQWHRGTGKWILNVIQSH